RVFIQGALTQIVDLCPRLDRNDALEDPLDAHLGGQECDVRAKQRRSNREGEGERRFAAAHVAPEHVQITATKSAAETFVDTWKAAGECVARRGSVAHGVDPGEQNRKRRDV